MRYALTDWTELTDQDAAVRHLVELVEGEQGEEAVASFSRTELGEKLADAALALANGDLALTGTLPPANTRGQTIIVNGRPVLVPWDEHDNIWTVAERAVDLAGYGDIITRPWEVKDAEGRRLLPGDDLARIRHISLPAGTAA